MTLPTLAMQAGLPAPAGISRPADASRKAAPSASQDILIVRNGDHYRLLHGQLRLVAQLCLGNHVSVNVRGEGEVRIVKAGGSLLVERGEQRLPLLRNR